MEDTEALFSTYITGLFALFTDVALIRQPKQNPFSFKGKRRTDFNLTALKLFDGNFGSCGDPGSKAA